MAMQALVMGFGGTGAHILTALKELTVLKAGKVPDSIKFLLFDTIADWEPGKAVQIVGGAAEEKLAEGSERATSLDPATEYFYLSDHDPDLKTHVYTFLDPKQGNPERYPHVKDWLHAAWLGQYIAQANLGIVQGAAQQRQIGRFAMFQNSDRIVARVGSLIRDLSQHARGADVNVWIIGSSAGGTGAGCLLDAAYLTHLAAGNIRSKLTGVIVLPNVYSGVGGISLGRAYSLLRELDRVQGRGSEGIPSNDRYSSNNRGAIASHVCYDARMQNVATVKNKVFDDLFYLGSECDTEQKRKKFFTSVANSIDPYLDENSGPRLLEVSVNDTAAASSFGASRLYLPKETFADIFAWEEAKDFIEGATAPREEGGRFVGVNAGDVPDRAASAESKVSNLLALFQDLLDKLRGKDEKTHEDYARISLDPEQIVTKWYQFAGLAIAGEMITDVEAQVVRLTYLNPFLTLTEADQHRIEVKDLEVKTYKENREARGVKESQEESKDRFARRLDEITVKYTSATGGERSFERGRKLVLEKVSNRLGSGVDNLIIGELNAATGFAVDPVAPKQGTTLTRLYEEIRHILGDRGPLFTIDEIVGHFIRAMNKEKARRNQQTVEALGTLRAAERTGLGFGSWIESYQQAARQECADYIQWFQKHQLLQDMQQIVRAVRQRFEKWNREIGGMLHRLALDEGEEGKASLLFAVKEYRIKRLNDRMHRAARNPGALISFEPEPDPGMMGYRQHLKEMVKGLANELLTGSRWDAVVDQTGTPRLKLAVTLHKAVAHDSDSIMNFHQNLHDYFKQAIDNRLANTDIFDFLLYIQRNHSVTADRIAQALNNAAEPLINAGTAAEECKLVYAEPSGDDKRNLAGNIQASLQRDNPGGTRDAERTHSDRHSISVLKIKKPSLDQIRDLQTSLDDYLRLLTAPLNDNKKHNDEVYRAQVFHPFRPELEAWYIERAYFKKQKRQPFDVPVVPRVARLLEDPAMMQMFVHCIAAGAIERVPDQGWMWHSSPGDPSRDVFLTEYEKNAHADVLSAAIIFVLQKTEGRQRGTIQITLEDARRSFTEMIQSKGLTRRDALDGFRKNELKSFLDKHSPNISNEKERAEIRQALEMVFDFYLDPDVRTSLQDRVELP